MAYKAVIDYKREFGVEIECYGGDILGLYDRLYDLGLNPKVSVNFDINHEGWTVSNDTTIIGENSLELISPPLSLFAGIGQIYIAEIALHSSGFKVNDSCALHVHWDVSDLTGSQIQNLLKLYSKFEPVIDYLVSPDRRGDTNRQCRSLIKNGGFEWVDDLAKAYYSKSYDISNEFQRTQKLPNTTSFPTARHHKVNLASINKYGTVEFRQHQGTVSYLETVNWIHLTGQLINRVKAGVEIKPGKVSLGSFIKLLGLTHQQLLWIGNYSSSNILHNMRNFYKKRYKENKKNA